MPKDKHMLKALGYIDKNITRELKVETVPYLGRINKGLDWKPWRLVALKDDEMTDKDLTLLDEIAEMTEDVDANFAKIREAYRDNGNLSVPDEIIARY